MTSNEYDTESSGGDTEGLGLLKQLSRHSPGEINVKHEEPVTVTDNPASLEPAPCPNAVWTFTPDPACLVKL